MKKRLLTMAKQIVQSVANQLSHRRAAVHATGWLPRRWRAAIDQIKQQSGAASSQQRNLATSLQKPI